MKNEFARGMEDFLTRKGLIETKGGWRPSDLPMSIPIPLEEAYKRMSQEEQSIDTWEHK